MDNDEFRFTVYLIAVLVLSLLFAELQAPKKEEKKQPIIVNNYISTPVVKTTEIVYKNISSRR